mmetsp:Transcript_42062/g.98558  ORF Transcript_42062/g.98558 Transcript_42062/m.98558 type:complete len:223 (-) Transcript_42062:48-716(-)
MEETPASVRPHARTSTGAAPAPSPNRGVRASTTVPCTEGSGGLEEEFARRRASYVCCACQPQNFAPSYAKTRRRLRPLRRFFLRRRERREFAAPTGGRDVPPDAASTSAASFGTEFQDHDNGAPPYAASPRELEASPQETPCTAANISSTTIEKDAPPASSFGLKGVAAGRFWKISSSAVVRRRSTGGAGETFEARRRRDRKRPAACFATKHRSRGTDAPSS